MWLCGFHVNNIFKRARKQMEFVALISKSVSLWEQSQHDKMTRRKSWARLCVCLQFVLCAFAHVRTCLLVIMYLCVWQIFCTSQSDCHKGCFVSTLFSTLILSLAENNYSLFVSHSDGGRTTQKPVSFHCFTGWHIAQEGEQERGWDNSKREMRP